MREWGRDHRKLRIFRGAVFSDHDGDARLDLFNLGQRAMLFRNGCSTGNGWLTVRTVRTTMIRDITAGSRQVCQSMMAVHFGLGGTPVGRTQTLTSVEANRRITMKEPH